MILAMYQINLLCARHLPCIKFVMCQTSAMHQTNLAYTKCHRFSQDTTATQLLSTIIILSIMPSTTAVKLRKHLILTFEWKVNLFKRMFTAVSTRRFFFQKNLILEGVWPEKNKDILHIFCWKWQVNGKLKNTP